MGNGDSRLEPGEFSRNSNAISNDSELDNMKSSIEASLKFHEYRMSIYKKILVFINSTKNKFHSSQSNFHETIELSTSEQEQLKEREQVKILFKFGVLKTESLHKHNDQMKIVSHPNFETIYETFIENLRKLIDNTTKIKSNFSESTVHSDKIRKDFEENIKTINKAAARILFYKYSIVYNNYLMHLYSIYSQAQYELFVSKVKTRKKQNEFIDIQRTINEKMNQLQIIPSSRNNIFTQLSNMSDKINKNFNLNGGSNSNYHQNLSNILSKLDDFHKQYIESNKLLEEFLNRINQILDDKIQKTIQKYSEMRNTTVINSNLINALNTLEKQINSTQITSQDKIEQLINDILPDAPLAVKDILREYLTLKAISTNASNFNNSLIDDQHQSNNQLLQQSRKSQSLQQSPQQSNNIATINHDNNSTTQQQSENTQEQNSNNSSRQQTQHTKTQQPNNQIRHNTKTKYQQSITTTNSTTTQERNKRNSNNKNPINHNNVILELPENNADKKN